MKKLTLCLLVIVFLTTTAWAQFYPPRAEDRWVIGIGSLEALFSGSIVNDAYNAFLVLNPHDSWDATFQGLYAGRADVDARVEAAIKELCAHDQAYCDDVFQRRGLRWKP